MTRKSEKPLAAIGHVELDVTDVIAAAEYFAKLGLRLIHRSTDNAILELRGGTHLLLMPADHRVRPGTAAPFDLMVDNLEDAWKWCKAEEMTPSEIESGSFHESFTLTGPDGYRIKVNSSHTSGRPV